MVLNVPRNPCIPFFFTLALLGGCGHHHDIAVTTYHYDNLRTGWNPHEDRLAPENINASHFGVLYTTTLDGPVEAQPLVVPGQNITAGSSPGKYEVVYAATENNTVYAIDANSGKILLSRALGTPVPLGWRSTAPVPQPPGYTCTNDLGINSTPVIDLTSNTMYAVAYVSEGGTEVYRVHALDLSNLTDRVAAPAVAGSHTLTDGSTFSFEAGWQRQRPGLLLSMGKLYVAFGSFCDWGGPPASQHQGDNSRGWVFGFQTPSLAALSANQLNNQLGAAASPTQMFLSSVWMSGYGPAADASGSVYFVTGNSDSNFSGNPTRPCGGDLPGALYTTYTGAPTYANIQNSIVKVAPDLSAVQGVFTPWVQAYWDECDADYGSGGAMLLPDQKGPIPHLVAAAGKDGKMFLQNRDSLGGYNAPKYGSGAADNTVALVNVGPCWCGPSYFEGEEGPYIVSSGGINVNVWRLRTEPSVSLIHEGTSPDVVGSGNGGQDSGFFTFVSSHHHRHTIIWAVSHKDVTGNLWLYAFKGLPPKGSDTLPQLFAQPVATWGGGNANVVPVVANGKVFVATTGQLTIFGLK